MSKKQKDMRSMNDSQLNERLTQLRTELVKMNGQVATGTAPKNPGLIRQSKRDIARILTIFNERSGKNGGAKQA